MVNFHQVEPPVPLDGSSAPSDRVLENIILTLSEIVVVILSLLPAIVFGIIESIETTLQVFRPSAMWATILNSGNWIFYNFTVIKKDDSMELVLAHPMVLASSFFYLLIFYGHHRRTWMVTILSALVIPCVAYVFYATRFRTSLPESWEMGLGCSGLLLLLWSHTCLMQDIHLAAGYLDYAVTTINIVLPGLLNGATVYISLKNHPEQHFVVLSALIGFICFIVEVMLLISKLIMDNCYGAGDNGPDDFPNPNAEVPNENHPVIDHAENENANGANDVANGHDPAAADQNVNGHNNGGGVHEDHIDIVVNGSGAAAGNHNVNVIPAGAQHVNNVAHGIHMGLYGEPQEHHESEDHRPRVEMRADINSSKDAFHGMQQLEVKGPERVGRSMEPDHTCKQYPICIQMRVDYSLLPWNIYFRKEYVYDLHHAILGILFPWLITGVITDSIKDCVGRPRPDFFWRCFPDGKHVHDDITTGFICHGEKSVIKKGHQSFPSGHISWFFGGLSFLALAGKIMAFDRKGHVAKLCIVFLPLIIASLVAVSLVDDYWHHWQDVFTGALIGLMVASFCYLLFFPYPFDADAFWPHAYMVQLAEGSNSRNANSYRVRPTEIEEVDIPDKGGFTLRACNTLDSCCA